MCGVAGFLDFHRSTSAEQLDATVRRMRDALVHRGPDDAGVWVDAATGIAIGHRRLSIIDLSPLGRQPMMSASGRYVIAFNGEIYNFVALRRELGALGAEFRGQSDTEVILAAVDAWGLSAALDRFNGMFAIALWDREQRALYLARDRFGEKPMYYGLAGHSLVFGSEIKALRTHPAFDATIDRASLSQYLRLSYVPTPRSIFVGIKKLPAGTWLRIASALDVERTPEVYWSMRQVAERAVANPFDGSEEDAVHELTRLIGESVRMRMVADVPLGAFLSGGIDSSTVVALMHAQSSRPVRTFTIGFAEQAYNEARAAKKIAKHLGTDHTELYVSPEESRAVIPRLPELYDEPFADASQIPTFLLAQMARRHVTVSLSGDGGDELFGGYNRYQWAERIWRRLKYLPPKARSLLASTVLAARPSGWAQTLEPFLSRLLRQRNVWDKLQKLGEILASRDSSDVYLRLVSTWKNPSDVVLGVSEPENGISAALDALPFTGFTERMMYADTVTYLPDDILVKVDRASMAVGLEARVPLLDAELVAFAWSLPLQMKVRGGKGKLALRRVLARYVPSELFERPKMGFGLPIDEWLRGPLRSWAESVLSEQRLRRDGYFDPRPIRQRWHEHVSNSHNWQYYLWPVLMFQTWIDASKPDMIGEADGNPAYAIPQLSSAPISPEAVIHRRLGQKTLQGPIKVLHLITGLNTGGAERMLSKLAPSMDCKRVTNVVVSMLEAGPQSVPLQAAGVPVFTLEMQRGVPNPGGALRFARHVRDFRPDVLQTWMPHADLLGTLVGSGCRVPNILWNIRCTIDDPATSGTSSTARRVLRRLSTIPRLAIANSSRGKEEHERAGYRCREWRIIPNGFDVDAYRPRPELRRRMRAELGIPQDALVVGLVARFHPMKDHATFCRAAGIAASRLPNLRYLLVGSSVTRDNEVLRTHVERCQIADRVTLLGERRDMVDLYQCMDVATLSSAYGEGFPNVLGEAMACGVPCVTTDVGDAAEIVADTGITVPVGDAEALARAWQVTLLKDRNERQAGSQAARNRVVAKYALRRIAEIYTDVYEEVVEAPEDRIM
jgi:asparagine synthase (glutamine-hydrolysing)